ncbi:TadE/TadG family type IV pilus assembly protein [Schaalia naturae]|uniref:TadE/TadG family type IV pilus assembly protein n=1 Tax=Schaalia naturae TaxID=635203 RepID=A0ABW2SMF5_9ACTO
MEGAEAQDAPLTGGPPRGVARRGERGSEVVSHVLIQGLVVLLVLMVMQLAFALHTRNLAISAAGEGARRAALAGGDTAEAAARTGILLDRYLGEGRPREISVSTEARAGGGRGTVVVTVRTALPLLAGWGPSGWLTVRGRSVAEVPGGP